MYIGKIEADAMVRIQPETGLAEPRGSIALGLLFLAIALPYWAVRLLGAALWRDLRRAGRLARMSGASYADALAKR